MFYESFSLFIILLHFAININIIFFKLQTFRRDTLDRMKIMLIFSGRNIFIVLNLAKGL
jgi:hypothetical protein